MNLKTKFAIKCIEDNYQDYRDSADILAKEAQKVWTGEMYHASAMKTERL